MTASHGIRCKWHLPLHLVACNAKGSWYPLGRPPLLRSSSTLPPPPAVAPSPPPPACWPLQHISPSRLHRLARLQHLTALSLGCPAGGRSVNTLANDRCMVELGGLAGLRCLGRACNVALDPAGGPCRHIYMPPALACHTTILLLVCMCWARPVQPRRHAFSWQCSFLLHVCATSNFQLPAGSACCHACALRRRGSGGVWCGVVLPGLGRPRPAYAPAWGPAAPRPALLPDLDPAAPGGGGGWGGGRGGRIRPLDMSRRSLTCHPNGKWPSWPAACNQMQV